MQGDEPVALRGLVEKGALNRDGRIRQQTGADEAILHALNERTAPRLDEQLSSACPPKGEAIDRLGDNADLSRPRQSRRYRETALLKIRGDRSHAVYGSR